MTSARQSFLPSILLWSIGMLAAQPSPAQAPTPPEEFVTTHGQVMIGGKALHYTARAGQLPIYDNDTGALVARMFVIAYVAERNRGEALRPLTFIWNGGPGSSSSQVQLMGFGPKGFETPPTYPQWTRPYPDRIGDRPYTLLQVSDLVFMDPIGTGYSRATSESYRDMLYTTHGDAEAVAEAIRLYRTRYDAFDAPLFLLGESYGTIRAMAVAAALEERRTRIDGIMLLSGFYDVGQKLPASLDAALQVPMYTAAAYFHHRLARDLQALTQDAAIAKAMEWARHDYAPALEHRVSLTPDQYATVLHTLSRYTGIQERYVDNQTLVLTKTDFADHLLEDRDLELGRYDMRMVAKRRDLEKTLWLPLTDASLAPMIDLMQGTSVPTIRYMRDTLQYRSDLLYQGPFGEAFHPLPLMRTPLGYAGDWMTARWEHNAMLKREDASGEVADSVSGSGPLIAQGPNEEPLLRHAMKLDPDLLILNARGLYDMSCPAMDEAVARSDSWIRDRVRNSCFPAGHMGYTDVSVRQQLLRDFAQLVREAEARRSHS